MRLRAARIALVLFIPAISWAKAYFAPIEEMIRSADVIAIVQLTNIHSAKSEEAGSVYKDLVAEVKFEKIVHGTAKAQGQVYIPSFFPCAPVSAAPGRYLMFLVMRNGILTNSNWHLSLRPLKGDKVEWFSDERKDFSSENLTTVQAKIEKVLKGD